MTAFAPARVLLRSSGLVHQRQPLLRGLSQPTKAGLAKCASSNVYMRWFSTPSLNTSPSFAFSFDIDGVLLHKSEPIPGAAETLKYLQKRGIPFVFLTNGGGKLEAERAAELSGLLGIDLAPSALIQSHTPFKGIVNGRVKALFRILWQHLCNRGLPDGLGQGTVMVTGSDASKARKIAIEYGFKSVVTPGDILKACPEIFPFHPLPEFYDKQEVLPLPKPLYSPSNGPETLKDCLKIDAVLVFNDPRDWAVDTQLIQDLHISHQGYLGTKASDFAQGGQGEGEQSGLAKVPIIFSNSDQQWSAGYHIPRLGQGAFQKALHNILVETRVNRQSRPYVPIFRFGKPYSSAYQYAEAAIRQQLKNTTLNRVYMVGDNPESDILGANSFNVKTSVKDEHGKPKVIGPEWRSCLVRTGVYKDGDALTAQNRKPTVTRDDVKSAVEWALREEGRFEEDWLQKE